MPRPPGEIDGMRDVPGSNRKSWIPLNASGYHAQGGNMTRGSERRRATSANRNAAKAPHGELATAVVETMDRADALRRTLGPVTHGQAEVRRIRWRIEKARAELKAIDSNLESACDAALAEFYLNAAERLLRQGSRASLVGALEGWGSRARIPKLFDTVLKHIDASGYEADLDDLRMPLNTAGKQLIALILAGEKWPVLLAGDSEAPIIGRSLDRSDRSTLQRMWAEERQISADGGVTELRNPSRAIAGLMTSLASWLPFRIVPKSDSGGGSGGRVAAEITAEVRGHPEGQAARQISEWILWTRIVQFHHA